MKLFGISKLARRWDVHRDTARSIVESKGFPVPTCCIKKRRLWSEAVIETWETQFSFEDERTVVASHQITDPKTLTESFISTF